MKFGMFYEIQVPKTRTVNLTSTSRCLIRPNSRMRSGMIRSGRLSIIFFQNFRIAPPQKSVRCSQPTDTEYSDWTWGRIVTLSV